MTESLFLSNTVVSVMVTMLTMTNPVSSCQQVGNKMPLLVQIKAVRVPDLIPNAIFPSCPTLIGSGQSLHPHFEGS